MICHLFVKMFFISLIRACVSNEILEKGSSVRRGGGGGEYSSEFLGGVPSGSLNPDPISDQNMPFSIRLYVLAVLLKTIPDFRLQWSKPISIFRPKRLKSIRFGAAHTYIADIGKYSPGMCQCVDLS